jgi:hypothetical protein
MRKGFLLYEELCPFFVISHSPYMTLHPITLKYPSFFVNIDILKSVHLSSHLSIHCLFLYRPVKYCHAVIVTNYSSSESAPLYVLYIRLLIII